MNCVIIESYYWGIMSVMSKWILSELDICDRIYWRIHVEIVTLWLVSLNNDDDTWAIENLRNDMIVFMNNSIDNDSIFGVMVKLIWYDYWIRILSWCKNPDLARPYRSLKSSFWRFVNYGVLVNNFIWLKKQFYAWWPSMASPMSRGPHHWSWEGILEGALTFKPRNWLRQPQEMLYGSCSPPRVVVECFVKPFPQNVNSNYKIIVSKLWVIYMDRCTISESLYGSWSHKWKHP